MSRVELSGFMDPRALCFFQIYVRCVGNMVGKSEVGGSRPRHGRAACAFVQFHIMAFYFIRFPHPHSAIPLACIRMVFVGISNATMRKTIYTLRMCASKTAVCKLAASHHVIDHRSSYTEGLADGPVGEHTLFTVYDVGGRARNPPTRRTSEC